MKKQIAYIILILFGFTNCSKTDYFGEVNTETSDYIPGKGVFIVNEGNYTAGNASISFYNFYTHKVYNSIFYNQNKRPLGDVAVSMNIINGLAYIVVNNSGKIEVVNPLDFNSIKTISGFASPRFILAVNTQKAYVSDLRSPFVSIINLETNTISGSIQCGKSTDKMIKVGKLVFVCNWSEYYVHQPNNTIMVINTETDQLIDSIVLGKEPNSMVVDKNNKLWVLSSGGYNNEMFPELNCINTNSLQIEKTLTFQSKYLSPEGLCSNKTADSLFYINNHIYKMSVNDNQLPISPIIYKNYHLFYALAMDPGNNELYISDAIDYNQNGFVFRYATNGMGLDSARMGIIPGFFCFN
ncbi:MAG: DUF5074 domain-containing protein [Bacteroidota bacterium]